MISTVPHEITSSIISSHPQTDRIEIGGFYFSSPEDVEVYFELNFVNFATGNTAVKYPFGKFLML